MFSPATISSQEEKEVGDYFQALPIGSSTYWLK
jgi:hypothetical protein